MSKRGLIVATMMALAAAAWANGDPGFDTMGEIVGGVIVAAGIGTMMIHAIVSARRERRRGR